MYIHSYIILEGISNEMLLGQPTTEAVMLKLQSFVGNRPIIGAKLIFSLFLQPLSLLVRVEYYLLCMRFFCAYVCILCIHACDVVMYERMYVCMYVRMLYITLRYSIYTY